MKKEIKDERSRILAAQMKQILARNKIQAILDRQP
jgi:hypothetical protein